MLLEIFSFLSFFFLVARYLSYGLPVLVHMFGLYVLVICLEPGMLQYLGETQAMCSAGILTNNTLLCISSKE